MAFSPATDLKPGMVVALPITAVDGRVIIPPGTVLEAKHIHALRTWGIPGADVVTPATSTPAPPPAKPSAATPGPQPVSSGTGTTSIPNLARQAEVQKLMAAGEAVKKIFGVSGTAHPVLKDLARMALLRKANLWNAPQHQAKPKATDG